MRDAFRHGSATLLLRAFVRACEQGGDRVRFATDKEGPACRRRNSCLDNPKGWKLEDALQQIQNDILRRSTLIADDTRSEARAVLRNNFRIMNLITECIETAEESARILDSLGPARPGSRRRIGAGPPKA